MFTANFNLTVGQSGLVLAWGWPVLQ